ncbi:holin-like protein [Bacillus pakistanensis]|uniref:Holin-like protein n=1 Tax=Rossellomorea pakistanensis TaxID=992288 RepID=A0ABS2N7P4_9BACI|nr:CidA/LrgA family protein [Bacillus pakistanensis]MBM7583872.1 holin-like protein [Bacillus pakistanensis]
MVALLDLPIPGNIIGMLLLFILLVTGVVKLEWIFDVSNFLLTHLAFFFVPFAVGVMTFGELFLQSGWTIVLLLLISIFIGMTFTGLTAQLVMKGRKNKDDRESYPHNN